MKTERSYEGDELGLFLNARHWKNYWSKKILPHIGNDVLEVGAGFGSNTPLLCNSARKSWLCLEPDPGLAAQIPERLKEYPWGSMVQTEVGTLGDFDASRLFDTLLYIDVMEHIENDRGEMETAAAHLKPGGKIIVLSPAHQWLFSEFDRGIGHYRRYAKKSLAACTPKNTELLELYYLDSIGLLASMANKFFLHEGMPTPAQIRLWDGWLVTNSLWMDILTNFRIGKTIIGVWIKR